MNYALVLITGDRVEYIDKSVKSCMKMIDTFDQSANVDIFVVTFTGVKIISEYKITQFTFDKPENYVIDSFPKTMQQVQNYSNDIEQNRRISFGHYVLNGAVPNTIFENREILSKYDFILKSRSDLVFDFQTEQVKNFNPENQILTFECFWGGCRYNQYFTNDHIVFGKSEDVLKVISYSLSHCLLDKFWNPEHYMTYLFSQVQKKKIEITTDKYYLLSKDRESRKWIGFPLEKINKEDINFLREIGLDTEKISFANEYEL